MTSYEKFIRKELKRFEVIEKVRKLTEEEDVALFYTRETLKLMEKSEWYAQNEISR